MRSSIWPPPTPSSSFPAPLPRRTRRYADLAIQTFENVLKRDPNNTTAIGGLASIYQNTNQFQKAREFYLKDASLDPTNPLPFYAVGSVDWIMVFNKNNPPPPEEQGQLIEEGLSNLDKALALNPDLRGCDDVQEPLVPRESPPCHR